MFGFDQKIGYYFQILKKLYQISEIQHLSEDSDCLDSNFDGHDFVSTCTSNNKAQILIWT